MEPRDVVVLTGTANRTLAESVACELGVALGRSHVECFPDGEISVRLRARG